MGLTRGVLPWAVHGIVRAMTRRGPLDPESVGAWCRALAALSGDLEPSATLRYPSRETQAVRAPRQRFGRDCMSVWPGCMAVVTRVSAVMRSSP
jgi:hypothetical protein